MRMLRDSGVAGILWNLYDFFMGRDLMQGIQPVGLTEAVVSKSYVINDSFLESL